MNIEYRIKYRIEYVELNVELYHANCMI